MATFLRNHRTGKFVGSIGRGKTEPPTSATNQTRRALTVQPRSSQEIEEIRQRSILAEQEKREKKYQLLLEDLNLNLKAKPNPDGTITASVFRCGPPTPPQHRGVEADSYTRADSFKPADGRTGRTEAIFAAPSLGGVIRWVHGSNRTKPDIKIRELRINADTTYVYKIREWEKASYGSDEDQHKYWATGITYREWVTKALNGDRTLDPEEWELLIPANGVLTHKPVSAVRAASNVYETSNFTNPKEIEDILKIRK